MSSLIKGEIKVATAHEIGVLVDDLLEEATKAFHQATGGHAALVESAASVRKLEGHADAELTDGKLDESSVKAVKLYISRAASMTENLATRANHISSNCQGRVQALEMVVKTVKDYMNGERMKAVRAAAAPEGDRPGSTLKEQRSADSEPASAPEPVNTAPARKATRKRGK